MSCLLGLGSGVRRVFEGHEPGRYGVEASRCVLHAGPGAIRVRVAFRRRFEGFLRFYAVAFVCIYEICWLIGAEAAFRVLNALRSSSARFISFWVPRGGRRGCGGCRWGWNRDLAG